MRLLIFLSALLLLASCEIPQYAYKELPEHRIHFGSGGGFTGVVTEYVITPNGQVFRKYSNRQEADELTPFTPREARGFFESLDSLRLHKYEFNHPDNLYYFLRQVDDQIDHTVQWGRIEKPIREDVEAFYNRLLTATAKRSVITKPPVE